ncbi:hypothetical protein C8Q74DRAFT_1218337 [Fomes fomentarius]|nr:hypothetical protein C8Q74DRAFT_1218337 [Fomes fomentarius]
MTSHTPRASTSASAQGASWPLAPQIDGDAMLQIFIHKSIRYADTSNIPNSPYCDASTLAILGSAILEASYTSILYKENLKADEIETKREKLPELVEQWIKGYKWREKVRRAVDVDLEQAMVCHNFDHARRCGLTLL